MRTFRIATAIMTAALVPAVFAQDAGTGSGATTGSGTVRTPSDIAADIRFMLPGRNPTKLSQVEVAEQKQKAWDNESTQALERLAQHRRDCREAIRTANRDQLMTRATACYRSDLLQDVNVQRKRITYLAAIPSLDATIRASASGSIMKQIDAEMAIVNAIDTGLFTNVDGMEEAKKNLRTNYREAAWLGWMHVEADRELTYLLFILKDVEERLADSGYEGAKFDLLEKSVKCLESGASTLLVARSAPDRLTASAKLMEGREMLKSCRSSLKSLARKEQQEAAEKSEEGE